MPISPKDTKPITTSGSVVASESENQGDIKPSPPTVFTFTNAPLTSGTLSLRKIVKQIYLCNCIHKIV